MPQSWPDPRRLVPQQLLHERVLVRVQYETAVFRYTGRHGSRSPRYALPLLHVVLEDKVPV